MSDTSSAFSALKAFEAAKSDRQFSRMRGGVAARSPVQAMAETGYTGNAGRPTHTATGQRKIRGYGLAKRAEQEEKKQAERDAWFSDAAANRQRGKEEEYRATRKAFSAIQGKGPASDYMRRKTRQSLADWTESERVADRRRNEAIETNNLDTIAATDDPRVKRTANGFEVNLQGKT